MAKSREPASLKVFISYAWKNQSVAKQLQHVDLSEISSLPPPKQPDKKPPPIAEPSSKTSVQKEREELSIAPIQQVLHLHSTAETLSEDDVKAMLKKYNLKRGQIWPSL